MALEFYLRRFGREKQEARAGSGRSIWKRGCDLVSGGFGRKECSDYLESREGVERREVCRVGLEKMLSSKDTFVSVSNLLKLPKPSSFQFTWGNIIIPFRLRPSD